MGVNLLKVKQKTEIRRLAARFELAAQYALALAAVGFVLWFGWQHRLELAEIPQAWRSQTVLNNEAPSAKTTDQPAEKPVYRWRDRRGVLNFSDQPPR